MVEQMEGDTLIPVEQTRFNAEDGNCHPACIASILEVPLDAVPQPTVEEMASYEGWGQYCERLRRNFLHPRNLHDIAFPIHSVEGDLVKPPGYAILCAKSPRTSGYHSVVAFNGEIVWDPHPQREMGVGEWSDWTVFMAIDPAKVAGKEKTN
jgi:hypothetical protein